MSFGTGCARALLIIFNFIFWLSGAGILGVGIWLLVDKNIATYISVVQIDTTDPYFTYAAYILIGFGVLVFVVGFCGCCGAIRGSKCMLGAYIFFLLIIMGGELAAGIMAAIFQKTIGQELQLHLKGIIRDDYNVSSTITTSWDIIQIQLQCCGATNPDDYDTSVWRNATSDAAITVPTSCCVLKDINIDNPVPVDYAKCQSKVLGKIHEKEWVQILGGALVVQLTVTVVHIWSGCYDQLWAWFKSHMVIIIGVGCGVAGLEIFGLIFAICLCRHSEKDDDY